MAARASFQPAQPPGVWRRLFRNKGGVASLVLLGFIVLVALVGPLILPAHLKEPSTLQFAPPSAQHFFGTDLNGRDLFARVIEGAQISLLVGLCGALISFGIGTTYGMISGYIGGRIDGFMMRLVEILYAVPRLILVIIASFTFDPGLRSLLEGFMGGRFAGYSKVIILIVSLGVIEWLTMARIVRGQVLALREQQFVVAARSLGQSHIRIIFSHIFPNLIGIVIVYLTLTIPAVILDESFLSFLGLGVQAPQASWGSLLTDGAQVINPIKISWWLIVFPAGVMSLTLLALNFLGDALRDALDPRSRG